MNKLFIVFILILTLSCWSGEAINSAYNFNNIQNIEIDFIEDHTSLPGSGEMVKSLLTHNFLKYGFEVIETDVDASLINIGSGDQNLKLSCIITELTDSDVIIIPYRYEDRGYTKTILNQTSELVKGKEDSESSASSSTETHAGGITQGSRIEYTQSRVGLLIKIHDKNTKTLVWSNSFWYSGLELQRTINICLKNGVLQIQKLFS